MFDVIEFDPSSDRQVFVVLSEGSKKKVYQVVPNKMKTTVHMELLKPPLDAWYLQQFDHS